MKYVITSEGHVFEIGSLTITYFLPCVSLQLRLMLLPVLRAELSLPQKPSCGGCLSHRAISIDTRSVQEIRQTYSKNTSLCVTYYSLNHVASKTFGDLVL